MKPFLSIVLTGRNDDFGGDFNERFFRAVRFNRSKLDEYGIEHEFIFVEWNPIPGKPYLAELLRQEFPWWHACYIVDPPYHSHLTLNPKMTFMEFFAKNVGIRRARGEFVLTTNTDIYFDRGVLKLLARKRLKRGVLYRCARTDLRLGLDFSHVDWPLLEDPRNHSRTHPLDPPLYTDASGDFLLLDRHSYHRLRGFNEVYRVAKIHLDSNFCVKAYAAGCKLEDTGENVYHLDHLGTYMLARKDYEDDPSEAPWGDDRWPWRIIYENTPDWGLGKAPAKPFDQGIEYLVFDREALPPLVDLRRVLLPPGRLINEERRQIQGAQTVRGPPPPADPQHVLHSLATGLNEERYLNQGLPEQVVNESPPQRSIFRPLSRLAWIVKVTFKRLAGFYYMSLIEKHSRLEAETRQLAEKAREQEQRLEATSNLATTSDIASHQASEQLASVEVKLELVAGAIAALERELRALRASGYTEALSPPNPAAPSAPNRSEE